MRHIPSIPSYLRYGKGGIFRFRRAVPRDLREPIGKTEIVRSLKTRDPRLAIRLGRLLAAQVDQWFDTVRNVLVNSKEYTEMPGRKNGDIDTGYKHELTLFPDGSQTVSRETSPEDIAAWKAAGLTPAQIFELIQGTNGESVAPTHHKTTQTTPSTPQQPDSLKLSELVERYNADRVAEHGADWQIPKGDVTKFRRLIEILGDIPSAELTRDHARLVRTKLSQLPRNAKPYQGMTVDQVLLVNHEQTLGATSIKHYMTLYAQLFKWARRERLYIDENPFEALAPRNKTPVNQRRDPFSREELRKIFSGPQFTSYNAKQDKPHDYWAPLIALFTGARTAEIGALTPYDVFKELDGSGREIWCININIASEQAKEVRKRAKTHSSIRAVPLHPKLLELGFLEYCECRKYRGKKMLFDLTWSQDDGYGRNIRDRFHPYLKKIGIYEKIKKVFYSFRHTMHTELERVGAPIHHIERLTGHTYQGNSSAGKRIYITPREASELYDSLSKLDLSEELKLVEPYVTTPTRYAK